MPLMRDLSTPVIALPKTILADEKDMLKLAIWKKKVGQTQVAH